MTRIAIIAGSTRPGRNAGRVAGWVHERTSGRQDASFEIVDLVDFDLPHLDEKVPAAAGIGYEHPHTRAWAETISAYDGYVFVTPEYNHSAPAALKNAIDFLYAEWADKAAGFVSYGGHGGVRAVEHLRGVMGELKIADVRSHVALSAYDDFDETHQLRPRTHQEGVLTAMLDEVVAWAEALRLLRLQTRGATAAHRFPRTPPTKTPRVVSGTIGTPGARTLTT